MRLALRMRPSERGLLLLYGSVFESHISFAHVVLTERDCNLLKSVKQTDDEFFRSYVPSIWAQRSQRQERKAGRPGLGMGRTEAGAGADINGCDEVKGEQDRTRDTH